MDKNNIDKLAKILVEQYKTKNKIGFFVYANWFSFLIPFVFEDDTGGDFVHVLSAFARSLDKFFLKI